MVIFGEPLLQIFPKVSDIIHVNHTLNNMCIERLCVPLKNHDMASFSCIKKWVMMLQNSNTYFY